VKELLLFVIYLCAGILPKSSNIFRVMGLWYETVKATFLEVQPEPFGCILSEIQQFLIHNLQDLGSKVLYVYSEGRFMAECCMAS
jgi:hypothetical protein